MTRMLDDQRLDRLEIRELLENWVLWRDAGEWARLATLWHPDGLMRATWFQAMAADFIARSRAAFDTGLTALHMLGGSSIDIAGDRAIAQTRMQILQRAPVDGVLVDVICYGRFWDALERHGGKWKLRFRQPVYELDHMIPVNPARPPALDPERLALFPEGYRNLAYLQSGLGFEIDRNLPGTRGPEIAALVARGHAWLTGSGELE